LDGNPDTSDGSTAWRSVVEANPYVQVDLGKSTSLSGVSLYLEKLAGCASVCTDNPAYPRNVRVSVFNDPTLLHEQDPAKLAARSDVDTFPVADPALRRSNIETRMSVADPSRGLSTKDTVQGRYIRVQMIGAGQLRVSELQAYAVNDYDDPAHYPAEVRAITGNSDYFEARVWEDATQTFKWIKVSGQLLYDGSASETVVSPAGVSGPSWNVAEGLLSQAGVAKTTKHPFETAAAVSGGGGLSLWQSLAAAGSVVLPRHGHR
jgi:hypothetical protein